MVMEKVNIIGIYDRKAETIKIMLRVPESNAAAQF